MERNPSGEPSVEKVGFDGNLSNSLIFLVNKFILVIKAWNPGVKLVDIDQD